MTAAVENDFTYVYKEYFYATEANLATLDELVGTKRTPKCRITRQLGICERMIKTCMYMLHKTLSEWRFSEWRTLESYPRVVEVFTRCTDGNVNEILCTLYAINT